MFCNVKDSILQARMSSIVFIVIFFYCDICGEHKIHLFLEYKQVDFRLDAMFERRIYGHGLQKTALFCKPYISIKSARNSQTAFYILPRLIFIYFNTGFHPWYEIFFVLLRSKRGRCLSGTMSSKCAAHGMICFQANVGIYLRNYFNPLK